ncbi:TPA: transporter substrate-binding domain-containing protein [Streptococcus suis]|nr:transporter substrate-binding domain-containing protein [Streptococcus suis]
MKIFKPIFAIFSVLAAVILVACSNANSSSTSSSSSTSGATARTLEEIKESGTVKIGVFSDKKPFGYVDANGEYQGYDVYLGNRLAKELGVEVEYVPVGGIILYIKKPFIKGFFACLKRICPIICPLNIFV